MARGARVGCVVSAGYVVRGKHKGQHAAISDVDGTSPADRKPNPFGTINEAVTRVVWLGPFGWSDVAIYRVHPDGREERLPSYEEALTLLGADPLTALEAAERRLLEAGGWREIEPGGRWYHPVIGHRWKGAALADEKSRRRERLAAKGGA